MNKFGIIFSAVAMSAALSFAAFAFSNNSSKVITEENIYATIAFGGGDTIINMEDTEQVYDFADAVVIGTITAKYDATMSELSPFPYTPSRLKIDKVIKGEINDDTINLFVSGGSVSVKEFINGNPNLKERAEKMGLTSLSESQQENNYIQYISNHKKEYEVGNQYIIALNACSDSGYTVISDNCFIKLEELDLIDNINSKEDVVSLAGNNE